MSVMKIVEWSTSSQEVWEWDCSFSTHKVPTGSDKRNFLYVVLDHICDLLCNAIETGAQMSRDLSGHHARVDDAHIRAIVQAQTTIDDTA